MGTRTAGGCGGGGNVTGSDSTPIAVAPVPAVERGAVTVRLPGRYLIA